MGLAKSQVCGTAARAPAPGELPDHGKVNPCGSLVFARPRPDLDPSVDGISGEAAETYTIGKRRDVMAVFEVLRAGPGECRLGYREAMVVEPGDIVMVSLLSASHWLNHDGETLYVFKNEHAALRLKGDVAVRTIDHEIFGPQSVTRWASEPVIEVLQNFVLLADDDDRMQAMSGRSVILLTGAELSDGVRGDESVDNRFPMAYRRVVDKGPGKMLAAVNDALGLVERTETSFDGPPGCMVAITTTTQTSRFRFFGQDLTLIRSNQPLMWE